MATCFLCVCIDHAYICIYNTQGILINGQFPGPEIRSLTNDNLVITVHNDLDEPFLLSWNGVHMRKNSYQDGVFGTTCPIPPGKNYTYNFQVKDQIGSYFYFPSLAVQKAVGGYGSLRIYSLPDIPVPFPEPAGEFTLLIGDWYRRDHKTLKAILDKGRKLPTVPDGVLINGQGLSYVSFLTVDRGKTYRFRISNVGLQTSLNFEILGHQLKLIEVEGTHTVQSMYTSLDIHVGQTYSVLVTMDQPPHNYSIVASTRFIHVQHTTGYNLHYSNSKFLKVVPPRRPEPDDVEWSIKQAQSIRTNLTASGPRANPQGDNHYGKMKISRTLILESSAALVNRKQRYAINGVSFVPSDTPLKLADYFKIKDVFKVGSIPDKPRRGGRMRLDTAVMGAQHNAFLEIVFQNREKIVQSYHLDGYNFWDVGISKGTWSQASRREYNLKDAVSRSTTQVYPESWTAVYVALDNVGMWNLRSQFWARQYLGQQFYLRVYSPVRSPKDEYPLPKNALLCGRASNRSHHS
ncbi:PREDICTED: L-ascorbate oxidase homolog [Camelina sativa]|uniref:L-ascorbate oxidase homolog n=1 Tax=Camelina sativa TaxID=90675 RepID=A0ABM1QIA2_CAMSA|nr:PREDICTED: L-ascorbate oxidase homolog [Camelina sativa]